MTYIFLFILTLLSGVAVLGQTTYKTAVIAFYNCENFYDTINDPVINDEEFLPESARHYTGVLYQQKVDRLAQVIATLGTEINADGPALLGLAEVENRHVLNDLIHHPLLAKHHYHIVHYDSRDARGVDVALLYNPAYFVPDSSRSLPVLIRGTAAYARMHNTEALADEETTYQYYSRDVLWIRGKLDGETIHLYVNHWPSRLGGETRTAPARRTAALVCRHHLDSIYMREPNTKSIVMGDLNDDPVSPSVRKVLQGRRTNDSNRVAPLFNPWLSLYRQGNGTLAYRDAWGLFDQILVSPSWLADQQQGFYYHKAYVGKKDFMIEHNGRYQGYPMRFWDGQQPRGGFSDHFPVYVVVVKKLQ